MQVSSICKAFENVSSVKMIQLGGFLGRLFEPLLKSGLHLIASVLKPLAKSAFVPLGLTTAASTIDAAIQKKIFASCMTTLTISNEEMGDIMKIVKSFKESGLLIKDVTKTIKNEAKERKRGFLGFWC